MYGLDWKNLKSLHGIEKYGGGVIINTFMWVCFLVEMSFQQPALLGMARPLPMITKARVVKSTLRVLFKCIEKSAVREYLNSMTSLSFYCQVMFALLFAAVAVAAIMAMLLYNNKFDPSAVHTVDTFFDSL